MILKAENISKRYFRASGQGNNFLAIQQVDMVLAGGQLTVLAGRSGSGKTTLLSTLAGLLAPTEGKVFLNDTDLYALDDGALARLRNQHMGVIPQGRAALDTLTVMENVLLPGMLYGGDVQGNAKRAEQLMSCLGIGHLRDAMPAELSGGELRRMSIARALAHKPDVILADEPTGDLDDDNTQSVLSLLRDAAREGAAVLMATHEAGALERADVVFRMEAGGLQRMEEMP